MNSIFIRKLSICFCHKNKREIVAIDIVGLRVRATLHLHPRNVL